MSARLSAPLLSGGVARGTKADPLPTGGWVLFSQMREGGVGEIVFLSPPLLSLSHLLLSEMGFGSGLRSSFFFTPFLCSRWQLHTERAITHRR